MFNIFASHLRIKVLMNAGNNFELQWTENGPVSMPLITSGGEEVWHGACKHKPPSP